MPRSVVERQFQIIGEALNKVARPWSRPGRRSHMFVGSGAASPVQGCGLSIHGDQSSGPSQLKFVLAGVVTAEDQIQARHHDDVYDRLCTAGVASLVGEETWDRPHCSSWHENVGVGHWCLLGYMAHRNARLRIPLGG